MDKQIRRMTPAEAEAIREQFKKATAKAGPGRFQHFKDDATRAEHLRQVAHDQQSGATPF